MSNPQLNKIVKNWDITASRVYSNPDTNLNLDASGNSSLILKTNGSNRLTINGAGLITFGTLGSYDTATNFFTGTKFVGDCSGNSTTSTNIAGGTAGQIPYQSGASTTAFITNGTAGQVLTSQGTTLAPIFSTVPVPANVFNNIVFFGTTTVTVANKLYYLATAGNWVLADYTNSIGKLLAIAVGTSSSVDGMYIASNTGNLVISVPAANIGDALFVTSVAGEIGIQPAGANTAIVRQIGYKISATEIKFFLYPVYISAMGSNGYGIATQIGGTSATITDTNSYQLLSWTNTASVTRTFTVTVAGLFDMLLVGGGGGGGSGVGYGGEGGGGGGAGQVTDETIYLPLGTYDVVVGAGGIEQIGGGAIQFGGASGINIQPVASAGRLRFESLGGVAGGSSWSGGQKGYNSGGSSYRGGYGGNPAVASFGLFGTAGGASNGSGNNGGGGGALTAGSTRTSTTPASPILNGGGGTGLTTTFTGASVTYGVGGCAGGSSGSVPAAPTANTGSGGAGAISTGSGQTGASGFVAIRYRL